LSLTVQALLWKSRVTKSYKGASLIKNLKKATFFLLNKYVKDFFQDETPEMLEIKNIPYSK